MVISDAGELAPSKSQSLKRYFHQLHAGENPVEGKVSRVLDVAVVTKHEIYLAIEKTSPGGEGRRVFARLCLLTKGENEGGAPSLATKYSTQDEWEVPALTNCPLRILYLLTPTTDVGALGWRLACYEQQIAEARRILEETKERYAVIERGRFGSIGVKTGEMMIERRFLILHQPISAEQTTRALLQSYVDHASAY